MSQPRLVHAAPTAAQPLQGRADDELMTLAQAGSREAFAVLVERHARRVVQCCARFTSSYEQAIESAQAVWVTVWEKRLQYQSNTGFLTWLITISRNRCRNELRRQRVVELHANEIASIGAESTPEHIDAVLVAERQHRVRAALARLPLAMREALLLRYGEELRYDEMAAVLGADESTLRSRVHHGLKQLKRKLESKP